MSILVENALQKLEFRAIQIIFPEWSYLFLAALIN